MSGRLHNCPTCTCHVAPEHRKRAAVNPDAPLYPVVLLFDKLLTPGYAAARAKRAAAFPIDDETTDSGCVSP